ncbi:hypothetical protein ANCCAN_00073 [Ancylostoma caninum]|uniref:Uncharacterized protein n=1 Tax=Ancylostoma caninum TaxID=29170 RepID=A0A368HD63_ANCCA|nr:hypothetical protein ANCCAN_00073 [Ancylostoma caninum]
MSASKQSQLGFRARARLLSSSRGLLDEYDSDRGCERAIVTCKGRQDVALMTKDNEMLSFGIGIDNVLKCNRRGRWTTEDVNGNKVEVRSLRCVLPDPYQPMPINN